MCRDVPKFEYAGPRGSAWPSEQGSILQAHILYFIPSI